MEIQRPAIRTADPGDAADWERMRQRLWPSAPGEHASEIAAFFGSDRRNAAEVFLAFDHEGRAVGFAEASIRTYAEGCASGHVTYLEGWFVEEPVRGRGIGADLVAAVEEWGRAHGSSELASDADVHNAEGVAAHRALGFAQVGRIVCFRKAL